MTMNTNAAIAVAEHHARAEIRSNTLAEREHHRNKMCDAIEEAEYPCLVLAKVIRRLGRHKAMLVELPENAIRSVFP